MKNRRKRADVSRRNHLTDLCGQKRPSGRWEAKVSAGSQGRHKARPLRERSLPAPKVKTSARPLQELDDDVLGSDDDTGAVLPLQKEWFKFPYLNHSLS